MAAIEFFVEGTPVPKARARVTRSGHTYTPAKTVAWEQLVAWKAKIARGPRPILTGKVSVSLEFYGARANADIDNLAKAVLDGMNGVIYTDDKQVSQMEAIRSSDTGLPKGVLVLVGPS